MDPEHPSTPSADGAPDLMLLSKIEDELDDVERALARIDEGTYGTCAACGEPIDAARLGEHPATAHCAAHATAG